MLWITKLLFFSLKFAINLFFSLKLYIQTVTFYLLLLLLLLFFGDKSKDETIRSHSL